MQRAGWSLTQGCRLGSTQFAALAAVAMCLTPLRTQTQAPTLRHSALAAAVTPPHLARLGCAPSRRWLQGCAGKAPVAEHRLDSQAPGRINAATSLRALMTLRPTIRPWLQRHRRPLALASRSPCSTPTHLRRGRVCWELLAVCFALDARRQRTPAASARSHGRQHWAALRGSCSACVPPEARVNTFSQRDTAQANGVAMK